MVNNGIIHAQYTNIKVTDGAAGIAIGTGGNIDFSNGRLKLTMDMQHILMELEKLI